MRAVLVDTGPLVALLDRSDSFHQEIVEALESITEPLFTVWPVIVEAMYLLAFSARAQQALWEIVETESIALLPLDKSDVPRMKALMEKYSDLPMDMADAALVHVGEREDIGRVLTLDQPNFRIYQRARKGAFSTIPQNDL